MLDNLRRNNVPTWQNKVRSKWVHWPPVFIAHILSSSTKGLYSLREEIHMKSKGNLHEDFITDPSLTLQLIDDRLSCFKLSLWWVKQLKLLSICPQSKLWLLLSTCNFHSWTALQFVRFIVMRKFFGQTFITWPLPIIAFIRNLHYG